METETLKDIASQIAATSKPRQVTVRQLLGAIDQERRGKHILKELRRQLKRSRLKVDPDFENVHVDALVTLTLGPRLGRPPRASGSIHGDAEGNGEENNTATSLVQPTDKAQETNNENSDAAIETAEIVERDVIITVRQGIPAAGRVPMTVRNTETVRRALTTLIDKNIGHLVVLQSERGRVEGIFSWQSYGCAVLAGKNCKTVGECLSQDFGEVNEERPLFDAVQEIIRHGVVVVRARDNKLCGLVTTRDAAEAFVDLSEPFLFLGQIENHLRELVNRMELSEEDLRSLVDPRDTGRADRTTQVEDLTLGELIRAIQKPEFWERLKLGYEREILLKRFEALGKIRNKVMHFDADGISPADKEYLKETRRMLQEL